MTDAFSPLAFPVLADERGERETERARIRGHAAGFAAGQRAADAELDERRRALTREYERQVEVSRASIAAAASALASSIRAFDARAKPVIDQVDASILAAAIEIAEALLGHELTSGPSSARATLERALRDADEAEVIAVRLSVEDAAEIGELADLSDPSGPSVKIVADRFLQRGDAVVELSDGFLDARISASLARMRAALTVGDA